MSLAKKNILIVDDDPSHRMLLRKVLENAGCLVEDAESVTAAIKKFQAKIPDLIVLDLNMPEHDGFTFLKLREKTPFIKKVPVLVQSSATGKPSIEKALAMGANQFLEKPLNAGILLQKLRSLLYSQEISSFQFPKDKIPSASVELNALVTGVSETRIQISSVVKFDRGKPIEIKFESYQKSGGAPMVGRVDNRLVEIDEGLFTQVLTLVGLSNEERGKLQLWQRTL